MFFFRFLFSLNQLDERSVRVFDEGNQSTGRAQSERFVCNRDFLFPHQGNGLFHVLNYECKMIECNLSVALRYLTAIQKF